MRAGVGRYYIQSNVFQSNFELCSMFLVKLGSWVIMVFREIVGGEGQSVSIPLLSYYSQLALYQVTADAIIRFAYSSPVRFILVNAVNHLDPKYTQSS